MLWRSTDWKLTIIVCKRLNGRQIIVVGNRFSGGLGPRTAPPYTALSRPPKRAVLTTSNLLIVFICHTLLSFNVFSVFVFLKRYEKIHNSSTCFCFVMFFFKFLLCLMLVKNAQLLPNAELFNGYYQQQWSL